MCEIWTGPFDNFQRRSETCTGPPRFPCSVADLKVRGRIQEGRFAGHCARHDRCPYRARRHRWPRKGNRPPQGQTCELAKAFDAIAKKAWSTAIRGINQHRQKFREFALQIFGTRKPTDVVANAVVERVFGKQTLAPPLLDLQSATLNYLAVGAPVRALAGIWESADSSKLGGHSILQNGNKLDTAGVESLFDFLGERLHTLLIFLHWP